MVVGTEPLNVKAEKGLGRFFTELIVISQPATQFFVGTLDRMLEANPYIGFINPVGGSDKAGKQTAILHAVFVHGDTLTTLHRQLVLKIRHFKHDAHYTDIHYSGRHRLVLTNSASARNWMLEVDPGMHSTIHEISFLCCSGFH